MVKIPKPDISVGSWNQLGELSRSGYRQGYLNAAELLADATENTEGFDMRTSYLIYPMLNLYRHFVELTLKDFIDLAIFVGPQIPDLYDSNQIKSKRGMLLHDLQKSYDVVRLIISGLYVPPGLLDEVDLCSVELIEWFQKIDRKGDGFRYTLDRKSQAQFSKAFHVNLPWLRSKVKRFESFMYEEHENLRKLLDPNADDIDDRMYMW